MPSNKNVRLTDKIRAISGKCGSKNRRIQRLCRESILT